MISFYVLFFFFKQKTAYEMRISDWSSVVCSSDLPSGCSRHLYSSERTLSALVRKNAYPQQGISKLDETRWPDHIKPIACLARCAGPAHGGSYTAAYHLLA